MNFTYRKLNGELGEASFSSLEVVAEGPVEIANGWRSDRVNYCKALSVYIEFRSGPEGPPGIEPSEAVEVSEEYIQKNYGLGPSKK